MSKQSIIGLFGYGVAGQGFAQALQDHPQPHAVIRRVCIRDAQKVRGEAPFEFTDDAERIWNDDHIDVIVELIDDADAALEILRKALSRRIPVITANKKMLAGHIGEILELQQRFETPVLYEAACAAGIPIIRSLNEYYAADRIVRLGGVVNGSTNYILGKVAQGKCFDEARAEAQHAGFAEADPTLDVEGHDAAFKLCLLSLHALGCAVDPKRIPCYGIRGVRPEDIRFARLRNNELKLIARAERAEGDVHLWVGPALVDPWYGEVRNEYNAIEIESSALGIQRLVGKGAGALPTGQAVLADLLWVQSGGKYGYTVEQLSEARLVEGDVRVVLRCGLEDAHWSNCFDELHSTTVIEECIYLEGTLPGVRIHEAGMGREPGQLLIYCGRDNSTRWRSGEAACHLAHA